MPFRIKRHFMQFDATSLPLAAHNYAPDDDNNFICVYTYIHVHEFMLNE